MTATTPDTQSAGTKTRRFRLGLDGTPDFSRLLAAASVSFLGNGIYTTALPLMAASVSDRPTAVAAVIFAARLPWLLFSLPVGVLADRWDRKRVMWVTSVFRAVVAGALALLIATGHGSLAVIAVMSFLIACADVFFDSGSFSIVPKMVDRDPDRIRIANSRLTSAQITVMNFVGPPVGGVLFGISRSIPFLADAVAFLTSALLLRRMRGTYQVPVALAPRGSLLAAVAEGLRWVWRHPLLRWLTVISGVFSLVSMAQMSVLVLFADRILDLDAFGYGLLLTTGAVGSLAGTMAARHVEKALGSSNALAVGLFLGGCAALLMAYANGVTLAIAAMVLGGGSSMIWNVVQISLRQAATPDHLVGRVNGVHKLVTWGAMPIGALLGGITGEAYGLHAPFLGAGLTIVVAAVAARLVLTPRRVDAAGEPTPETAVAEPASKDSAAPDTHDTTSKENEIQ